MTQLNRLNEFDGLIPKLRSVSDAVLDPQRYSTTAIALHWLSALAVLGLLMVGWYMADLPLSPLRLKLFNWHKWAGVSVLGLTLLRLLWRWTHRPPALPAELLGQTPTWQLRLAGATHAALYGLLLLVPLIGWARSSAAGFSIVLFGVLPLPDLLPKDTALAELVKPWHAVSAYSLCALIALHVAAALKHQFVDKDGLMRRMWPASPARRVEQAHLP
ncbi:MAG: cytochrome b [Rhodoferax sp.]|nr:cytochrome b [Rhodoferax sp.]